MPAATNASSAVADAATKAGHSKTAAEVANSQAAKLLEKFNAAKPTVPDNYVPGLGMPGGGDIQLQPGMFTGSLIGPGEWPTESESGLSQTADKLKKLSEHHRQASAAAERSRDDVFSPGGHWSDGAGADAAYEHYEAEHKAHNAVVDVLDEVASSQGRLSNLIRLGKRNIRDAHDKAHQEIEKYLNAPKGVSTAQIAVTLTEYRTLIEEHRTELHGWMAEQTSMLTNQFGIPEAPPRSPSNQDKPADDSGRNTGDSTGDPTTHTTDPVQSAGNHGDEHGRDTGASDGPGAAAQPNQGLPTAVGPLRGTAEPNVGANGVPKAPSMPSMPSPPSMGSGGGSGGGGSSPLSSLGSGMGGMQGMSGGAKGVGGMSSPASGLQGPASSANPTSLGSEFGRGMAAGNAAAGGMPPLTSSAPPQTPSGPLSAAPLAQTSAPASAAPTASTVPASATPTGAGAGVGGSGIGGIPAGGLGAAGGSSGGSPQMTSYGSVLPPAAPAAPAGSPGAAGPVSSAPAAAGAAGGAAAAAGAPGFLPGLREVNNQRVGRDVSMTDLENARSVVADLAAASSVVYPGLEWAVAVTRGASGFPEMWVTTNEGAGYIPPGVYVRRSMPLAAHFDPDFDGRWLGWTNPAETVLRAVRMRGDALSAIATTCAHDSEEVRSATTDVAISVAPAGPPSEAEASALTRDRSHRLETIAPAVFVGLQRDADEAERYARQLTQQVVFSGPEMSTAAMSVARAIIAEQWPSEREWADLTAQYETDLLMAGAQRPGLMGVEEPQQLVSYQRVFTECRRLETLLCWQNGDLADVVYAAITAGASAPALV